MNTPRRVCIAAMTGEQPAWPVESLALGPFNIGRGNLRAPQGRTPDGLAVYTGAPALDVLSDHDFAILQHWPHERVIETLHARGTRVGLWLNIASFRRDPLWNTIQEPARRVCELFPLAGTDGKNVATWPGADACDTSAVLLPEAMAGVLDYVLRTSYPHTRPDFLFIDELTDAWFCRAANAPARDAAEWLAGVDRIVHALQGMLPVWGHNTGAAFQAIRTRVYEHATRGVGDAAGMRARVDDLARLARGGRTTSRVVLGWERADDVPASWLRDLASPHAEILLQGARTGRAFQYFDPLA